MGFLMKNNHSFRKASDAVHLCERDPWFLDSQREEGEEILEKKGLWDKFRVFPDTDHGFGVCRG